MTTLPSSSDVAKRALAIAKAIQATTPRLASPPSEGTAALSEQVLPTSLVRDTRDYVERIVNQINGAYERGWFDACAVMIRRLVETLIIETFEHHQIAAKIKNQNGDFFFLADLVNLTLAEQSWNLGRNAKQALRALKDVGDKSAHSRRYVAHKWDIDNIRGGLRDAVQELVSLSNLRTPRRSA